MIPQNDNAPHSLPDEMQNESSQATLAEDRVAAELDANAVPSSDDPIGNRIIFVIVGMVIVMFIIALGFLFEVARRRPA